MTITGGQTYFQKIYPQTDFQTDIHFDEISDGTLTFRTDSGNSAAFLFSNGKIFDPSGRFISTYLYESPMDFALNFQTGLYSLFINERLCESSKLLYTGSYNSITGISFFNLSTDTKEISMAINGQLPSVTFGPLRTDNLTHFTGNIVSNDLPITLFNLYPDVSTVISYPTTGFLSGDYVISGRNMTSGNTESIIFSFDYGNSTQEIPVYYVDPVGPTGFNAVVFDSVVSDFLNVTGDYHPVTYQDVSFTSSWPWDTTLQYSLQFIGRSGEQLVTGTGVGTGWYSGYLNGSGYLHSTSLTGIIYPYGITGVGTGSLFAYTTGAITYEYLLDAVGYESGELATGVLMGEVTGNVGPNSGTYHFFQNVTGTPLVSVWGGGIFLNPTGTYTGSVNHTGILSRYMTLYGSGDFEGYGIVENPSGSISGFNLITGSIVDLDRADDYQDSYDNLYNLGALGFYNGNYLQDPTDTIVPSGVFSCGFRIAYLRTYQDNLTDYAVFHIWNEHQSGSYNINRNTL